MSSTEAAAVVDALQAAQERLYAEGDPGPLNAVLAEDIVWHVPGTSPIAGTYRGPAQVIEYMTARGRLAGGTFRMHRRDLLTGDGETVAALTDGEATLDGAERRWSTVGLYRLRGDRVVECWLLPLDESEFDDIWSAAGRRHGRFGPGHALALLGAGHAAWSAVAYGDDLRELARSGLVGSVGDGIFDTSHAHGRRAAAFWFAFPSPLVVLLGYHVERAARARDARALTITGRATLAVAAVGAAVIPRSGFWGALAVAGWLLRRGRLSAGGASRGR